MKHVYLAPHLDDGVLSCGSAIHHHTAAGEGVQVVTVFVGEAGRDAILSGFAREQHAQWGGLSQPMRLRRAEDVAAKASALVHYRSQMAILFGGTEAMPSRVWAFAATRTPEACLAERIWWPQ